MAASSCLWCVAPPSAPRSFAAAPQMRKQVARVMERDVRAGALPGGVAHILGAKSFVQIRSDAVMRLIFNVSSGWHQKCCATAVGCENVLYRRPVIRNA